LERDWRADKEAEGYVTFRAAGSKGAVDCIAIAPGDLIFAQCKSGGRSRFDGFGPADRESLLEAAQAAGARALLVRRYRGTSSYEEIPPEEWPQGSTPSGTDSSRQNGSQGLSGASTEEP